MRSSGDRQRDSSASGGTPDAGLVICGISSRNQISDASQRFLKYCFDEAPVVGFKVLKNDVLTVRAARDPDALAARLEGAVRGEIEEFSFQSRRRLAIVAANTPVTFRSFITLTYPKNFPSNGVEVKRHFNVFMKALWRRIGKSSYLWFLEFQRRGAPHFHMFLAYDLPHPRKPMERRSGRVRKTVAVNWELQRWISATWFEIVGSGDEKHLRAGASWEVLEHPDGAARYVAKESYKTFQKVVPKGYQDVGRFWGTSRDVPPDDADVIHASEKDMRRIFPPECFDKNGNPFPVMFAAAKSYKNVIGTTADPVKVRAWKRRESHLTDLTLTAAFNNGKEPDKSVFEKRMMDLKRPRPTKAQLERRE